MSFLDVPPYKEYESKPRLFSKNSFILSIVESCTPVNSIEKPE